VKETKVVGVQSGQYPFWEALWEYPVEQMISLCRPTTPDVDWRSHAELWQPAFAGVAAVAVMDHLGDIIGNRCSSIHELLLCDRPVSTVATMLEKDLPRYKRPLPVEVVALALQWYRDERIDTLKPRGSASRKNQALAFLLPRIPRWAVAPVVKVSTLGLHPVLGVLGQVERYLLEGNWVDQGRIYRMLGIDYESLTVKWRSCQ
jgi:hypothetical protein